MQNVLKFRGKPRTTAVKDRQGNIGYQIEPKSLNAFTRQITDKASLVLAIILGLFIIYHEGRLMIYGDLSPWQLLWIPTISIGSYFFFLWYIGDLLIWGRDIRVFNDKILIRKFMFFWAEFDRSKPHSFSVEEHPGIAKEQSKIKEAKKKKWYWKFFFKTHPYCEETKVLCFHYEGEVNRTWHINDKQKARRFHDRIQSVLEKTQAIVLNERSNSHAPEEAFAHQAGSLFDEDDFLE